ncbi:baculoviral IAP repeat-containing protein 5 [Leguminivora glycinivorella]|uniref:baculoviral IAP repeat-containing protein 5 n=1 Tax=Leguminivora glycinivorella TaxID=1035111 RepID=UPI00200FF408|nr:baculoviral IAP repeat-containing protein 5 [Leguminivora glycinivorella]
MKTNEMRVESRSLFSVDERVKTFKNWPFNDKNRCNVRNMAEAGFYSVATGDDDADAAKCFLCGKELDGWEPEDDPWSEHKSHASKCAFVQLGKNEDELLLSELLSVVKQYMINELNQLNETIKSELDNKAKSVRRTCLKL